MSWGAGNSALEKIKEIEKDIAALEKMFEHLEYFVEEIARRVDRLEMYRDAER